MDPAIKAFLDTLEASLEASTSAQRATAVKIDKLIAWKPDLERRITDLGDAVAALQVANLPPCKDGENSTEGVITTPPPATHVTLLVLW